MVTDAHLALGGEANLTPGLTDEHWEQARARLWHTRRNAPVNADIWHLRFHWQQDSERISVMRDTWTTFWFWPPRAGGCVSVYVGLIRILRCMPSCVIRIKPLLVGSAVALTGWVWTLMTTGPPEYQHVREITIMSDVSGFMSRLCAGERGLMPPGPECRTTVNDGQCGPKSY